MACSARFFRAYWPGLSGDLERRGERKKFCMSIITRAVWEGSTVMVDVVVCRVREGVMGGVLGVRGCVRSNDLVEGW